MNNPRLKRETQFTEEAAVSTIWDTATLVEVLERKGLGTKQDRYNIIEELHRK
ncbi:MAG TPA: hypothetical protein VKB81_19095 [Nitrospira sp.]|nr:hypothetical protein [Nitrospira sp.]